MTDFLSGNRGIQVCDFPLKVKRPSSHFQWIRYRYKSLFFATYLDICRENTWVRSERQRRWVCWPWCSGRIDPSCTSPAPLWIVGTTLLFKILLFYSNSALEIDFFSPLRQDEMNSFVCFLGFFWKKGKVTLTYQNCWNETRLNTEP